MLEYQHGHSLLQAQAAADPKLAPVWRLAHQSIQQVSQTYTALMTPCTAPMSAGEAAHGKPSRSYATCAGPSNQRSRADATATEWLVTCHLVGSTLAPKETVFRLHL